MSLTNLFPIKIPQDIFGRKNKEKKNFLEGLNLIFKGGLSKMQIQTPSIKYIKKNVKSFKWCREVYFPISTSRAEVLSILFNLPFWGSSHVQGRI